MASVHLGRLLGHAGFARTVAIKRLHPQYAEDPEFVAMLLDEARLVARIRHPNVVPTLDVAATDGELFLVMEYVQGESLSALIRTCAARGEPIDPAIATTILVGVHRDVSPQNVLVGVDGVARVLDFGIAKAAGRVQTTKEGQLKGKVAYMRPSSSTASPPPRPTSTRPPPCSGRPSRPGVSSPARATRPSSSWSSRDASTRRADMLRAYPGPSTRSSCAH
jgi:eukaryotic-like serine/threonine-protein kinase